LRSLRTPRGHIFPLLLTLFLTAGVALAQNPPPPAAPDTSKAAEQQSQRSQTLAEDRAAIERLRQEVSTLSADMPGKLQALQGSQVDETMVEQAKLETRSLRLQQEDLQTSIANAERQIEVLQQSLRELEAREQLLKNPAKEEAEGAERLKELEQTRQTLAQQRSDLELEKENLAKLQERLELTTQRLSLAQQWQSRVEELFLQQAEQSRQEAQQDMNARLEKELQTQLDKAADWRAKLDREGQKLSQAQRLLLETRIQSAEESAKLVRLDIRLARIADELAHWRDLASASDVEPRQLQEGLKQLASASNELQDAARLLQGKQELFSQQRAVIERREATGADEQLRTEELKIVAKLLDNLNSRKDRIQAQLSQIKEVQAHLDAAYKEKLSQALLARLQPPETLQEWQEILTSLRDSPGILFHQVRLSAESAVDTLLRAPVSAWIRWTVLEFALLGLAVLTRRLLKKAIHRRQAQEDGGFLSRLILTTLQLTRKNLLGMALAATVLLAVWVFQVPQPGLGIIITLVLLWVAIKTPLNLAWLLLASPHLPAERQRPPLYRQVFWTLLAGGILIGLAVLAHLSEAPKKAIRVFDLLFLVYWLLAFVPLLRIRRFALEILAERHADRLWFKSLRPLSLLLLLALLTTSLLGMIGYLNLAWAAVWYLLALTAVLAIWLIVRALLDDLLVSLKNYAVLHSRYGLLWTQEIITPLQRTLHILLLLGSFVVLLKIYSQQGHFPLFDAILQGPALLMVALALLVYELFFILASFLVEHTQSALGSALIRHSRQPVGLILPLAVAQFLIPTLDLSADTIASLHHSMALAQIAAMAWLIVRLVSVIEEVIGQKYLLEARDNLGARRVRTQFQMVRRIVLVTVYLIAIAAMLMTFPKIRQIGAGLLASAGIAGLVIGVAARPFLENLIAGIQIGLTQPIRMDDVVIVESEFGRVAEINATHVVVHVWDDRRLIVPLNYFNTQPFQNWTRTGSELLGTAFFYVDYTFPVEEGRRELQRILEASSLWDGRAWGLQVTNTSEHAVELRALMSAPNASIAWDLRCQVREQFIAFLQRTYPHCLPKARLAMESQTAMRSISPLTP
jgi:potassium efflux system protein